MASIGNLIEELNAKAAAAGCPVQARHYNLDNTWGDHDGVAIFGGTTEQRERAAKFVAAYYEKHLAKHRSYSAQYALRDAGEQQLIEGGAPGGSERFIDPRRTWDGAPSKERVQARVIGLVYWPCAD